MSPLPEEMVPASKLEALTREFDDFKIRLGVVARDSAQQHGWCEEINRICSDFGIPWPEDPEYEMEIVVSYKVKATLVGSPSGGLSNEFVRDSVQVRDVADEWMDRSDYEDDSEASVLYFDSDWREVRMVGRSVAVANVKRVTPRPISTEPF